MRKTNKIGIMGGTFNPVHIGHLVIAEDVREKFALDRVLFVPSGVPPHKPDDKVVEAGHRYEMVRRAVATNPYFEASSVEIDRCGYTYTVNTLMELKTGYEAGTVLYFIIGADIVPELTTWKEFRRVFGLCEFIAVPRAGFDAALFNAAAERATGEYGAVIHKAGTRLVDISSTEIRERCRNGKSIKYLVPEAVEEYIIEKGLYRKII